MTTRARRSFTALALSGLVACGGAGKKVALEPTHAVPAAKGNVRAQRTDSGNTRLDVEVQFLAPPGRVAPGSQVYIVWAQRDDKSAPQNIGALPVGSDRKGKLQTLTPLDRFEVFLTPEPGPGATEPTNEPVMRSRVEPPK
jgi:hypothetical protein